MLLAAWGPCGFSPVAPGTVGTLGAVPLCWALSRLGWPAYLARHRAAAGPGRRRRADRAGRYWGVVDASPIVMDEVVGYLLTMALVPFSWPAAAGRLRPLPALRHLKPWPVSALDRVKTGWGVMLDDVAAGRLRWVALQLLLRCSRRWARTCQGSRAR